MSTKKRKDCDVKRDEKNVTADSRRLLYGGSHNTNSLGIIKKPTMTVIIPGNKRPGGDTCCQHCSKTWLPQFKNAGKVETP